MNTINIIKPGEMRKEDLCAQNDNVGCSGSVPVAELEQLRAQLEREKNDAIAILS